MVTALGSAEALFEAAASAASHFSSKTSSRVDAERFQTVAGERQYAPDQRWAEDVASEGGGAPAPYILVAKKP